MRTLKDSGVIYCAIGHEHVERATISAKSILKINKRVPVSICTDEKLKDPIWDHIIYQRRSNVGANQYMLDKLISLTKSPYLNSLYLDTDTFILDDLKDVFNILVKFDLAVCHAHNRQKRFNIQHGLIKYKGEINKIISNSIPYAFSPIQGGVILYKNNAKVQIFFQKVITTYKKKNFFDDQAIIRELLWKENIKFYILPPEYNFNEIRELRYWKRHNFIKATPKIFHYTTHKKSNILNLIDKLYNIEKIEYYKIMDELNTSILNKVLLKIKKLFNMKKN